MMGTWVVMVVSAEVVKILSQCECYLPRIHENAGLATGTWSGLLSDAGETEEPIGHPRLEPDSEQPKDSANK